MLGFLLRALLFTTGACVLVVEILATRILAPAFGSSLLTLSSVLGVTLGALSIGYYCGGMLAEKRPSWAKFGVLISIGACTVVMIWPLSDLFLMPLSVIFKPGLGSLFSSITIFALPCVLLGTLSPYGIALELMAHPERNAGRSAGSLYFWSTLGSIAGSFAAGFLLIPILGIRMVITVIGLLLLIIGVLTILCTTVRKRRERLIILPAILLASFASAVPKITTATYEIDGVYQKIAVAGGRIGDRRLRILWQDRNPSSGINEDNDDLAFDYTRVPAVAWTGRTSPKRSLVIGAGAFVIPREIAASDTNAEVDVVDIEPSLESIATKYFRYTPSPRVHSIVADGRVFLRGAGSYDLIVADAYQATYAIPVHLTTVEFFREIKEHLTDTGMFIGNFIGSIEISRKGYLPAAMRTLLSVFPEGKFYAITGTDTDKVQNVMFIGCRSETCIDPCARALQSSADPILSTLCKREVAVDRAALEDHPLLTDDHAPVEWLTMQ